MNSFKSIFTVILSLFILSSCSKTKEVQPPNIVFILADDLGTDVLGCYGGTTYNTPNIDALANSGLKFNHCYSAPLCSPSRVKLLTGRYGFRTGQEWGSIPLDEITFGHLLKDAGYKTALVGKWQLILLKEDPKHIKKMGFEESSVFGWHEGPRYYEPYIYENGEIKTDIKDKYGPDVYSDYLIDFIKQNKNERFLAYYPMSLPHDISDDLPIPPPFGSKGRYESYKENVAYVDLLVGKVIQTLDSLGIRDKTLVVFSGDNGTPNRYITKFENGEYIREPVFSKIGDSLFRGGKGAMTDAGTHVPLIANWKGTTPKGQVNNDLIDFSDFMPTFVELAGGKLPKDRAIDGHSFVQQMKGEKGDQRNWVYQEWRGKVWIRTKEWKLYENGDLYDMVNDPYEKHPVDPENGVSEDIRDLLSKELVNLKK